MDVKEAVKTAKSYVAELFAEESLTNLGLEEIERDERSGSWRVTVGFSRPWNTARNAFSALSGDPAPKRAFRVVSIKADGTVVSVKRRDVVSD